MLSSEYEDAHLLPSTSLRLSLPIASCWHDSYHCGWAVWLHVYLQANRDADANRRTRHLDRLRGSSVHRAWLPHGSKGKNCGTVHDAFVPAWKPNVKELLGKSVLNMYYYYVSVLRSFSWLSSLVGLVSHFRL